MSISMEQEWQQLNEQVVSLLKLHASKSYKNARTADGGSKVES